MGRPLNISPQNGLSKVSTRPVRGTRVGAGPAAALPGRRTTTCSGPGSTTCSATGRRGRRLLRLGHPPRGRRRPARGPPGVRRAAVDQAAVPVRRRAVARRRPRHPGPGRAGGARPAQHRLAAPGAGRRHLDARRVGVPVVRRVGHRLPHDPAGARRPGVRQGAAGPDVPRVGDAPQRPAAGLRVGVRRRQPAGARLGRLARLPDRRLPRPGVPHPGVHQAAAQLLVVGQPQGRRRVERLRGRLPRDGQHRAVRPLRAAAAGLPARAVRRDQLDGLLLPADVQDRPRAVPVRPGLGRHRHQVPGALPVDRRGAERLRLARGVAVARGGRLLLRRPGRARRQAPSRCGSARWSACCRSWAPPRCPPGSPPSAPTSPPGCAGCSAGGPG